MNRFTVKLVGAAILASSTLTAVAPAEARHRHHHRDRVDGGDILAGIVLIGAIAAIAGSGKKDRERDREREWRDDPQDTAEPDQDYRAAPDTKNGGQWVPGGNSAETRAVDACSWAAEGEIGEQARVGQIDGVTPDGDGWRVTGNVAAPETMPRDFTCTYRAGRVTGVSLR